MHFLYSVGLGLAVILASPWWITAMLVSGKYREGLGERLGRVPARILNPPNFQSTIWIHAVSVGELLAAVPLIMRLRQHLAVAHPATRVVISTTTRTGQQLAREKFGMENVFYFPFDFAWSIDRYIHALHPRLLVLLETEFWPNFLDAARRHGIPLAVVNGRVSDRSFPRYRWLRGFWSHILEPVSIVLAQSELDGERLKKIGVPSGRIRVVGNLKYDSDAATLPASPLIAALKQHLPAGASVFVCGSTAAGEEAALLEAHASAFRTTPSLITILAPRHPERFEAVAAMLPPGSIRRSVWFTSQQPLKAGSVFLLDSIGELSALYSLATLAYVGGSLFAPGGGHNPIEPANFSVPILTGPFMQNFRGISKALHDAGGIITTNSQSMSRDVAYLLQHPRQAASRGKRALQIVQQSRGATERTLEHLLQLFDPETYEPPPHATEAEFAWENSGRSSLSAPEPPEAH